LLQPADPFGIWFQLAKTRLTKSSEMNRGYFDSPEVLYHCTSVEGAESLISSQRFRATAHDCTHDVADLPSVESTILDALAAAQQRTRGRTAQILRTLRMLDC
jgi:hypothetical protein